MATRNGEQFIKIQLQSLATQTYKNFAVWVSDDGSTDNTLGLVEAFQREHPDIQVKVLQGPRKGFVRNFLSLACNPDIEADHFAFCDQDDIWHDDKLEAARTALESVPADRPTAYVSRTRLVDEDGEETGFSGLFSRPPSLQNALVQSIGGGNTMVFNTAARDLLIEAGPEIDVPSHDWWTYLAVMACGGATIYDETARIDYRQHSTNVIGENSSLTARMMRVGLLMDGRFSDWISANLAALERLDGKILPASRTLVDGMKAMRSARTPTSRLRQLRKLGLYRQTGFGDVSLLAAVLLKKI